MNYKLCKHSLVRLKSSISKVVTGFDVNILVGCCIIGMCSSVYGLQNTQQMNASLNKVRNDDSVRWFYVDTIFLRQKDGRENEKDSVSLANFIAIEIQIVITIFTGWSKARGIMCKHFSALDSCTTHIDHVRFHCVRVYLYDAW